MNEFETYALALGKTRNAMRELFEFGKVRKAEIGDENVYDFSLGNPSVVPPPELNEMLISILNGKEKDSIHCYTSAQGDAINRKNLASSINRRFNAGIDENDIYFTVGAAAALTITFHALNTGNDEFIVFAPYFGEYKVFITGCGAVMKVCPPDYDTFEPDLDAFEKMITEKTKGVVINSPNNPSGVVYREETIRKLADILENKSKLFGHSIYLITDEPYREIVFDGRFCPWIPSFYKNTIVCYSYSKSLSIPGERVGYILINHSADDRDELYYAVCGAGRKIGYINAPSLFQRAVSLLDGTTADMSVYEKNRDLLYGILTTLNFECIKPQGTFYLLMKSPISDAKVFCEKAKEFDLLLVPTDSFDCPGYVRIAFCVKTQMIISSSASFEKLARAYSL